MYRGPAEASLHEEIVRLRRIESDSDVHVQERSGWLYSVTEPTGEGRVVCMYASEQTAMQQLFRGEPYDWQQTSEAIYMLADGGRHHFLHRVPLVGLVSFDEIIMLERDRRTRRKQQGLD